MVHHLEVPLPLARLQIDANEAFSKQIVPGPISAVEIGSGRFNGQVDKPEFLVNGNLRPDTGIAIHGPRVVQPRIIAKLARPRNRVERPK